MVTGFAARVLLATGCFTATFGCAAGTRERTPGSTAGRPGQVPSLFDPTAVYRQLGLIVVADDLPFVGTVRLLALPAPDSSVAVVALSLQNRALRFRRDGNTFVADYAVELVFRRGASIPVHLTRDERVRVSTFRETQRDDESVIFQQFVAVQAGQYVVSVTVRDREGPASGRYEMVLTVPPREPRQLSAPLAVYHVAPRAGLDQPLRLIANPRATVAYGTDSLRFYVEGYALPAGAAVVVSALNADGQTEWVDTVRIDSSRAVSALVLTVPPQRLAIGRHDLHVAVSGGGPESSAPYLVGFSDHWAVANFDEILSLLRYFADEEALRRLRQAAPADRPSAWQAFWSATDPNLVTPEHEALEAYFERLKRANGLFTDEGVAGWLTDRGEVFILLGEPDEVSDRRMELSPRGRQISWSYTQHRVTLVFVDEGMGRLRLIPQSRAEFMRLVGRLRRGG